MMALAVSCPVPGQPLSPHCCAQCPPPAAKSGTPKKVNHSRHLQNIFISFVFIQSLLIWFFHSEWGHFLSSSKQKRSSPEKWEIWKFCSFLPGGNSLLLDFSPEYLGRNMSSCFRIKCTPQQLNSCTHNYIYN